VLCGQGLHGGGLRMVPAIHPAGVPKLAAVFSLLQNTALRRCHRSHTKEQAVMSDIRYSTDHTWARLDADGFATVGITDYAQAQLGDVVYVELPPIGRELPAGEAVAVVESVKSASDVKLPLGGSVAEVNTRLADEPELVNTAPEGDGWFLRLKPRDASEMDRLLDRAAYEAHIATL
jgi:glycine cleavage system H protein